MNENQLVEVAMFFNQVVLNQEIINSVWATVSKTVSTDFLLFKSLYFSALVAYILVNIF